VQWTAVRVAGWDAADVGVPGLRYRDDGSPNRDHSCRGQARDGLSAMENQAALTASNRARVGALSPRRERWHRACGRG
jgi:hypothetical protein